MSTFSTVVGLNISTTETLTNDDLSGNTPLRHTGYDIGPVLTATSTPDVTAAAYQTFAMVAGAKTIDMTNLLLNAAAVTLNTKKPRALRVTALEANSANVAVVKGASSGYDGLGAAFSVTLEPGMSVMVWFSTQGNAVTSGNKTLDVSGTGTDGVQFSVIAGT